MTGLLSMLNPGWLLIAVGLGALFLPVRRVRQGLTIAAPIIAILLISVADRNVNLLTGHALGIEMILYRVDNLSYIFGLAFLLAALLNAIYAWHTDDRLQDGMSIAYAGAAVAATFSGDMMTLFVFWELTAITSVFLILRAGTRAAYFASMRYLGVQILSGVLLLAGIGYVYQSRGDLSISAFT
ncbi:MAG TPA: Na(+)/H(+) antiporter subunit D, partial [Hyphomonas sp.]|nr:Na(+)/H(+) antiporter subunit D [Hyphomonas sp.]